LIYLIECQQYYRIYCKQGTTISAYFQCKQSYPVCSYSFSGFSIGLTVGHNTTYREHKLEDVNIYATRTSGRNEKTIFFCCSLGAFLLLNANICLGFCLVITGTGILVYWFLKKKGNTGMNGFFLLHVLRGGACNKLAVAECSVFAL
jgi:hypothetical protein